MILEALPTHVLSLSFPGKSNSNSAEFCSSVVLIYSCCGVGIELAMGSLPYPRQSGATTAWYTANFYSPATVSLLLKWAKVVEKYCNTIVD